MNAMNDDAELLRDFALRRNEASFRELVARRIGFVYAINLRRLRNPHLAQEATQAVFIALARKAGQVAGGPSVLGWLHRSSCYESRNLMRAHFNRTARETEAQRLGTTVADTTPGNPPGELEAVLDEALGELAAADRDAILARFFSSRTYAEIGQAANLTENAARMRVDRALDRLREKLARRGLTSTAAVLAATLPHYAAAAVPAAFSATMTNTALAAAGAAVPAALFFTMSTAKITTAAALAVAGVIGFGVHHSLALESELATLRTEQAQATTTMQNLQAEVTRLRGAAARDSGAASSAGGTAIAATATTAAVTPPKLKPGVTREAPAGWFKNGSKQSAFDVGVDANESWGGMPSAYAKSISPDAEKEFGGMAQSLSAEQYRNQRVRLSGWMKTQDVTNGAGQLWLRVDGQSPGSRLGFDNMEKRAPQGTSDWEEYSIVLDVPNEATSLNYGFFLKGQGQVWVNAVTITPVGPEVPTTNMLGKPRELPKAPVNLGFKPAEPSGG
jgi:RNA polymerase sigma factor (sigma-70 family)